MKVFNLYFAADMGIYRLIILFLLGALTLQVEAQDEFVPIDGEPRIKVVFYKKYRRSSIKATPSP